MKIHLALCLLLPSCASLIRGTDQYFALSTEPPYATVQVNEEEYVTPVLLSLRRDKDYHLLVRKAGYQNETPELNSELSAAMLWNLGCPVFLPAGLVLDWVTGATFRIEPQSLSLRLNPVKLNPDGEPTQAQELGWTPQDQVRWDSMTARLFEAQSDHETYSALSSWTLLTGSGLVFYAVGQQLGASITCSLFATEEDCKAAQDRANRRAYPALSAALIAVAAGLILHAEASDLDNERVTLVAGLNAMNLHYGPPVTRPRRPPDETLPEDSPPLQLGIEYDF